MNCDALVNLVWNVVTIGFLGIAGLSVLIGFAFLMRFLLEA